MSCQIKHPSEYTQTEVRFFLIAIGMESKVEIFEENAIDGQLLVTLTKEELEVDLGCSSIEVRKFTLAIAFSKEIAEGSEKPEEPTCKPPKNWSEVDVCIFLVAIGLGTRVEEFKKCGVTGSMAISLTAVELEKDCGLSSIQVKKFQASIEVVEVGGAGNIGKPPPEDSSDDDRDVEAEAEAPTYPIVEDEKPKGSKHPVLKNTAIGAAAGVTVGAIAGKLTGDTKKGAKIGTAVGAAGGIVTGLAQRRRQRKAARK